MPTIVSVLRSPLILFRMPARTWLWFGLYLTLCGLVLGGAATVLIAYQEDARQALIAFLFPESWGLAVGLILDRFVGNQQRIVVINAVVAGGLLLTTMTLFAVKETVSQSLEKRGRLTDRPMSEHPLWEQGWEEVKLFVLFIAVQSCIFWIGYHPGETRATAALILSHVFLALTFSIDFISPVFQRHNGHYSTILKTLARRPFTSLLFGALFSAPVVVISYLWAKHPEWSWERALALLFGVNVLCIAWATVAGTWLGAKMLPSFEATRRSSPLTRIMAYVLVLGTLGYNGYRFGAIGRSVYHKTQILKCDYDVSLSSFGIDTPSLLSMVGSGKLEVGVHFELRIKNPTSIDVRLEDNHIDIAHAGDLIGEATISPMTVPAGETITKRVGFEVSLSPLELRKGTELFAGDAWTITLYIEVADGFEFPIYLLHPD